MKRVPFVNRRYRRGVPFLSKMVYKRVSGRAGDGLSPYKNLLSTTPPSPPPPPPPSPTLRGYTARCYSSFCSMKHPGVPHLPQSISNLAFISHADVLLARHAILPSLLVGRTLRVTNTKERPRGELGLV